MNIPQAGKLLFLGVGGMGMAPLARWMSCAGYAITGYDDNLQEPVRRILLDAGVELNDLRSGLDIDRFDVIVRSSAVQESDPLITEALSKGVPVLRRGEMLARIAEKKHLIAVAGSHGKTTTSGMIACALEKAGMRINYILGGLFQHTSTPASAYTESEWLLAEIDESDGTIDGFSPTFTILLNIDWDHADHYTTEAMLRQTFAGLIERTRGTVIVPHGEIENRALLASCRATVQSFGSEGTYSLTKGADGCSVFSAHGVDYPIQNFPAGDFNRVNGTAALALVSCLAQTVPKTALSDFPGMARRQTVLYEDPQFLLVEDYAHHPTEIEALIQCLRLNAENRRLVVVFQPHRFSRTKQFKADFAEVLGKADQVYLLPVYAAHEVAIDGGAIGDLLAAFGPSRPRLLEAGLSSIGDLFTELSAGGPTTLAFVGAGDIEGVAWAARAFLKEEGVVDAAWQEFLRNKVSEDCVLKTHEPLAKKTTIRIGGAARYYAEPANLVDLRALLTAARLFEVPFFCLGRGSNVLVPDTGFPGLVIRFSAPKWREMKLLGDGRIWVGAGVRLKKVCGFAAKHGLKGFEFLEGIPGAVGGSLRMNAGAMGSWIFDVVERVQYLDGSGLLQDRKQSDFHFGYRKVEEISCGIAIGAVLKSSEVSITGEIREQMDSYSSTRKASQPREPSAGCIFKNPEGNYAGKLIDENDLKGLRVGGAEVSSIHGNFIVNQDGATAADVIELIRKIRRRVKVASGYTLEPEVLLMGQSWDEVLREECVTEGVDND